MSKNQARKETSAEAFTRIALENKVISYANKIQQNLERERRLANKNNNQVSNQAGTKMSEETLKAEILMLKTKVETQNADLTKFGTMQNQYFANIKELDDAKKEDKGHALAILEAQQKLAQINLETAKLGLKTCKFKQDNMGTSGTSSNESSKRNRLFSGKQTDVLSVRNWILTTEVNLKASKIGEEFQANEAGVFLKRKC
jgi:secreted trypsin-like serine protease